MSVTISNNKNSNNSNNNNVNNDMNDVKAPIIVVNDNSNGSCNSSKLEIAKPDIDPMSFIPDSPDERADTLAIKDTLSKLLTPLEGQIYWATFADLLTGKITQEEWDIEGLQLLADKPNALELHNALVLAILHNTASNTVPPPRGAHSGWPGRRPGHDSTENERDPKRIRLRDIVYSLGPTERKRLKSLPNAPTNENESYAIAGVPPVMYPMEDKSYRGAEVAKPKVVSAAMQQEIQRWEQAPLCVESKELPDTGLLRDRMSYIAYECGLNGTDDSVAHFVSIALEMYLKNIMTNVVELVQSKPSETFSSATTTLESNENKNGSSAMDIDDDVPNEQKEVEGSTIEGKNHDGQEENEQQRPEKSSSKKVNNDDPLTLKNIAALLELSPHALTQPNIGAIERLFSTGKLFSSRATEEDSKDNKTHEQNNNLAPNKQSNEAAGAKNDSGNTTVNGKDKDKHIEESDKMDVDMNKNGPTNTATSDQRQGEEEEQPKKIVPTPIFNRLPHKRLSIDDRKSSIFNRPFQRRRESTGALSSSINGHHGLNGDSSLPHGSRRRESFLVESSPPPPSNINPHLQRRFSISTSKPKESKDGSLRRTKSVSNASLAKTTSQQSQEQNDLASQLFPETASPSATMATSNAGVNNNNNSETTATTTTTTLADQESKATKPSTEGVDNSSATEPGNNNAAASSDEGGSDSDDADASNTKQHKKRKSNLSVSLDLNENNNNNSSNINNDVAEPGPENSSKKENKIKKDSWKMDVVDPYRLFNGTI